MTAEDCYAGPEFSSGFQIRDDLNGGLPYCAELVMKFESSEEGLWQTPSIT